MLDTYLKKSIDYLKSGVAQENKSFQYLKLSTIDSENRPRSRTVVLREVSDDLEMIIFTDGRTEKVSEIRQNPEVHLIGYHHDDLTQLRIQARADIIQDSEERRRLFEQVTGNRLKDYTVKPSPGTEIDNPSELSYMDDQHFFCPLRIQAYELEYLELKRPNHLRAHFIRNNGRWEGKWIAP